MDSTPELSLINQAIQKLLEENRNKDASGFLFPEKDDDRLLLSRLLSQLESFKEAKGFYQLEVSRGQETVSATVVDGGVDTESQDADVENENNEVIANIQEIDEGPTKVERLDREKESEEVEALSRQGAICSHVIDGKDEDGADQVEESNKQTQEIIEELRRLKRQNSITHWLLSTTIVLILAWQLSEVSLILKAKEVLNHPFRTLGGMLAGMLKRPGTNGAQDADGGSSSKRQPDGNHIQTPSLKMPELPHVDLPGFNTHDSNNESLK